MSATLDDTKMVNWLASGEAGIVIAKERYKAFCFAREAARNPYDYSDSPGFEALEATILRVANDTHNIYAGDAANYPSSLITKAARDLVSAKLDTQREIIARMFDLDYNYIASFEVDKADKFPPLAPGEIGKAILATQSRIAFYERALSAEQIAIYGLNLDHKSPAYEAWVSLQTTLAHRHHDSVRDLFTFAGLLDEKSEELRRLLKKHYARVFDAPQAIMHYLDPRGASPSGYSVSSEAKFRGALLSRIKAL
jgi:hypothetical protein